MSKKYYEHEDRFGKKFYSEDRWDPEGKGNNVDFYPSPITAILSAIFELILCPLVLSVAHSLLLTFEPSWLGITLYIIALAIIYIFFGLILGAPNLAFDFEDRKNKIVIVASIAYIISLIVWFLLDPPFIKWYDYAMSGIYAYILTLGKSEDVP